MINLAIGVDIGGTRTKSGLVNTKTGEVLNLRVHPTEKFSETEFLKQVGLAINEHRLLATESGSNVRGIGFGVPSFVDTKGIVDSTYGFLPFMQNYPLVEIINREFGLACYADNDARVVALGEALYGKGKGFDRVLVLTLGTGLGLGFVKNKKFEDASPYAHMGGHITVAQNDQRCYCGKTGCLESLVSIEGILYTAKEINWEKRHPEIPLTAESIFNAARQENTDAKRIVDKLINHLHAGINNYINLFAPDLIVIGGGIAKGLYPYIEKLTVNTYLKPYQKYTVQLMISELHEHAGIVGSAALVDL